jgi:hypothetical protein
MFRLVGIAASFGLLIGATVYAQAAYPCGPGYTLQDGFCKPYRGPDYGGGPYYRYRERYYDDDYRYYRWRRDQPHVDCYGRVCPRGFTVQDCVCKPYRGY